MPMTVAGRRRSLGTAVVSLRGVRITIVKAAGEVEFASCAPLRQQLKLRAARARGAYFGVADPSLVIGHIRSATRVSDVFEISPDGESALEG
jgi:hypothetical protein